MDKLYEQSETGCCLKFDPTPWDSQEVVIEGRKFIKDRVTSFLHIPLNCGQEMKRNVEKIMAAEAQPEKPLMLVDENSLWGADVYIEVSREVPGAEMADITGTFLTKVFEGHFGNMKKWIAEMKDYVAAEGKEMKGMYFFYTTCPSCAKHYGKNYVVIFARV